MTVETIGIQSFFETADFNKGLDTYLKGVNQATAATDAAAPAMTAMATAAAGAATGGVGALALMVANLASEIVMKLVGALTDAIGSLIAFGQQAMTVAGEVQKFAVVALLMGQRAGYSEEQINAWSRAMGEFEIDTASAGRTLAQFARYGLDLAQAAPLAAVAQDAAVFSETGASAAETLSALTQAIIYGQERRAKTAGISVDFTRAEKEASEKLGRALTEEEAIRVRLNAVIAAGGKIKGADAAIDATAAEQIEEQSFYMTRLQEQLGGPFQEAQYIVTAAVNDFIKALIAATAEGGALYPVLVNLGAIASFVAEGLAALVGVATTFVTNFRLEFGGGLQATANDALQWGINIVVALADGIIQASTTVLTQAMNVVGSMLSSWLSASSPPKVAPDLPLWGAAAMTEYLKGFTLADFGVLSDIQGTLKQVLSGPDFAAISGDLIAGLSSGTLDPTVFARITAAAGQFGAEVASLTRDQLALAAASEAAYQAQTALDAAQKKAITAQTTVSTKVREYNALVRAGASGATLQAKLAEVNAAQAAAKAAGAEVTKAEAAKKATDAQIKPLAEKAKLQELLVKQLLEMSKAQQDAAKAPVEKGAKAEGIKAGGLDTTALTGALGAMPGKITDAITKAVDKAKADIQKRLADLFAPLTKKWKEEWEPAIVGLSAKFNEFVGKVKEVWDPFSAKLVNDWNVGIAPILEQAKIAIKVVGETVGRVLGEIAAWWEKNSAWIMYYVKFAWGFVVAQIKVALALIQGIVLVALDLLSGDWGKAWQDIQTMLFNVLVIMVGFLQKYVNDFLITITQWGMDFINGFNIIFLNVQTAFGVFVGNLAVSIALWIADIINKWLVFWLDIQTKLNVAIGVIKLAWDTFWLDIKTRYDTFVLDLTTAWDTFWLDIRTKYDTFSTDLQTAWSTLWANVKLAFDTFVTDLTTAWAGWIGDADAGTGLLGGIVKLGKDIVAGLQKGVNDAWADLVENIERKITGLVALLKGLLGIKSPSSVFAGMGDEMAAGLMQGWTAGLPASLNMPAVSMMAATASRAAVSSPTTTAPPVVVRTGGSTTRSVNVTFGAVTIANGMDLATFEARVQNTVARAMRR